MVDQVASHYIRDWEAGTFVDVVSYLYYRVPRVAVLPCTSLFSLCVRIVPISLFRFQYYPCYLPRTNGDRMPRGHECTPGDSVAYSRYVHKYISYDPL